MTVDSVRMIEAARAVAGEFKLRENFSAGSVGAAVLAASGNIYSGICIDLACGLGFCAEVAALVEMLKARESHVVAIAAVHEGGGPAAPCGRCRETIAQLDPRNLECAVVLGENRTVALRTLLPEYWLPRT
jgi:cytidine deaminase